MVTIQFTSERVRCRKAIVEGYIYSRHRAGNETKWSQYFCIRRTNGCKGRIHISPSEQEFKLTSKHNHLPNFGESKAILAVSEVKRQAREEPNTHPLHITQQVLTAVDSETLVALPQEKSLKRSIQRVRREHQPALPRSLDEFDELPIRYREINGDNFFAL